MISPPSPKSKPIEAEPVEDNPTEDDAFEHGAIPTCEISITVTGEQMIFDSESSMLYVQPHLNAPIVACVVLTPWHQEALDALAESSDLEVFIIKALLSTSENLDAKHLWILFDLTPVPLN